MNELALFAGAGGGILGGTLLGWRTVCAVERDAFAAEILAQRQNDGLLDPFPIWADVSTFNGYPWQGVVEVVSGGFPCQDISCVGPGVGITGSRSGLWRHMARIIGEVRPRYAFIENSPMLVIRGLEAVLCDLAELGFDAEWGVVSAADAGANHKRKRLWILGISNSTDTRFESLREGQNCVCQHGNLADTNKERRLRRRWEFWENGRGKSSHGGDHVPDTASNKHQSDPHAWSGQGPVAESANVPANADGQRPQRRRCGLEQTHQGGETKEVVGQDASGCGGMSWWATEPDVGRVAHGVASRVDRIRALGNGQVPHCAAMAWKILTERINR